MNGQGIEWEKILGNIWLQQELLFKIIESSCSPVIKISNVVKNGQNSWIHISQWKICKCKETYKSPQHY